MMPGISGGEGGVDLTGGNAGPSTARGDQGGTRGGHVFNFGVPADGMSQSKGPQFQGNGFAGIEAQHIALMALAGVGVWLYLRK